MKPFDVESSSPSNDDGDLSTRKSVCCRSNNITTWIVVTIVLSLINLILVAAVVGLLVSDADITNSQNAYDNEDCTAICSSICVTTNASSLCMPSCYDSCTLSENWQRPGAVGSWMAPNAVNHVGMTTTNLSRSVEFYVDVLGGVEIQLNGGDDFRSTAMNWMLMGDAIRRGGIAETYAANVSDEGKDSLSFRFVHFGNTVVEMLDYRSIQDVLPQDTFPKYTACETEYAPSTARNIHIGFSVRPELDLAQFVDVLEAESHARGFDQVQCGRAAPVPASENGLPDFSGLSIDTNIVPTDSGPNAGLYFVYCKGPDGEQLEFLTFNDAAAEHVDEALQTYVAQETAPLWR